MFGSCFCILFLLFFVCVSVCVCMSKMYECLNVYLYRQALQIYLDLMLWVNQQKLFSCKDTKQNEKKSTHSVIDRWLKMELMWKRSKKKANTNDLKTKNKTAKSNERSINIIHVLKHELIRCTWTVQRPKRNKNNWNNVFHV